MRIRRIGKSSADGLRSSNFWWSCHAIVEAQTNGVPPFELTD